MGQLFRARDLYGSAREALWVGLFAPGISIHITGAAMYMSGTALNEKHED